MGEESQLVYSLRSKKQKQSHLIATQRNLLGNILSWLPSAGGLMVLHQEPRSLGWGTFVSAFTVLCGARTDLPDRHVCCVFWLNIAAALIQVLTAIVMVGWIMSIFWGMDMVILARYKDQGIPQQL